MLGFTLYVLPGCRFPMVVWMYDPRFRNPMRDEV
jgi:hypothetical protein